VVGGAVVAGGALATIRVIRLPGGTPAPDVRDWEITVPAGDRSVARYLTVALRPRSASAPLAVASSMPARSGTSTFGTVVGGVVEVVGTELVVVEEVAGRSAGPPASPSSPNATTPRRVIRAATTTYQRRHQGPPGDRRSGDGGGPQP
jgi:hypothetical protein